MAGSGGVLVAAPLERERRILALCHLRLRQDPPVYELVELGSVSLEPGELIVVRPTAAVECLIDRLFLFGSPLMGSAEEIGPLCRVGLKSSQHEVMPLRQEVGDATDQLVPLAASTYRFCYRLAVVTLKIVPLSSTHV